ncbi:MAG: biotin-dependent carboxyltransferase family protein [Acidisphaera sp.]|nr:biotin-dependent carboxyltransferase family protein [Acidisphaera sp.]
MTRAALLALAPGMLSTIQDTGRRGWQRFGVSSGGAMDLEAFTAANALLGNPPGTAAIEFAYSGGVWEVNAESCRLAVTGGDFGISVDGSPLPAYTTALLQRGRTLRIDGAAGAIWGYLAVAGGFDLPPQLGSLSTHLRAGIGGLHGRALRSGDSLPLLSERASVQRERTIARRPARPDAPIRVVLGPQDDYFTAGSLDTLLSAEYVITRQGDRMGYRLAGPALIHTRGYNIISDGVVAGSIQVPGTGQPIVLLMDRQPTGGYPKIATVISVDLGQVAQRRPGQALRFQPLDIEAAQELHRGFVDALDALPGQVREIGAPQRAQRPQRAFWLRN